MEPIDMFDDPGASDDEELLGLGGRELRARLVVLEHYADIVVMVAMNVTGEAKTQLDLFIDQLRTDEHYAIPDRLSAADAAEGALAFLRAGKINYAVTELSRLSTALWKPIVEGLKAEGWR